MVDMALMLLEAISVPIHRNMSPEQIGVVVDEVEAKYVFVSDKAAFSILGDYIEKIDKIVMFEKQDMIDTKIKSKISHFSDLMAETEIDDRTIEDWAHRAQQIDKNNIATIAYTSGTTGKPKGACLMHTNFISMVMGNWDLIRMQPNDRYLSILPLSHVMGRAANNSVLYAGSSIKYCNIIENISKELLFYRPTILIAVPRMFERIYEQAIAKANENIVSRLLFKLAMMYSAENSNRQTKWLFDRLIFSVVRDRLGGKVRLCFSGGGALDLNVIKFYQKVGINITEGYGLTETTSMVTLNDPCNIKSGTVGKAIRGMDIKIADDGEIIIKGTSLMAGYVRKEDEIGAFTDDGYFKTGDLGSIDEEGYLTILGRKKDILVLSTGENIAPVVIEQALLKSPYIDQALVIGDGYKHISAIIVVNTEEIEKSLKLDTVNFLEDDRVQRLIDDEVVRTTKDLPEIQQIRKYILATQPFTVENNQLSVSLKPRRQEILNSYAAEIKELYGR